MHKLSLDRTDDADDNRPIDRLDGQHFFADIRGQTEPE